VDTYLLVHRHPHNYAGSPEAAAAWRAWFDKLGDALVDKGNAVLDDRSAVGKAFRKLAPSLPQAPLAMLWVVEFGVVVAFGHSELRKPAAARTLAVEVPAAGNPHRGDLLMATITVPRPDVTPDEVAEALRQGLGTRYQVRAGGRKRSPADEPDRLTVGTGSARVFRANVTITRLGDQTTLDVHPGGLTAPLQLINRAWIVAKVVQVLRAAPAFTEEVET
jgi:hypothetical protein